MLNRYDAATNTAQKLTDITGGLDAALVVIEDCIFAIGGYQQDRGYTNVDKFDARKRQWSECASIAGWRSKHTAVAVAVGEQTVICVCSGSRDGGNSQLDSCLLYSTREDKWYNLPNLKKAGQSAAAVALPDGRVFVIGGEDGIQRQSTLCFESISSVEICHLREPSDWQGPLKSSNVFWRDAAAMLGPRKEHAAVVFRGCIFIAGGSNGGGQYLSTVDVFSLPDNNRPLGQWSHLANWDMARPTAALVVWQNNLFSFIEIFTLPDNQRPLGQWTHLDNWDTARPSAALVVCQDRLFSFVDFAALAEGPSYLQDLSAGGDRICSFVPGGVTEAEVPRHV
ncbi:unnamed protein product [Dibothriocephalus latus]|uniref:Uncharacterized protein n=1 Tax=Dibothriocephalus latus TaxID=60516 RepID=A0A3P7L9V9_DIBLA|nr:unnamed protein product [Dibothriocephalus latus]